jgi:hypothetical protein
MTHHQLVVLWLANWRQVHTSALKAAAYKSYSANYGADAGMFLG